MRFIDAERCVLTEKSSQNRFVANLGLFSRLQTTGWMSGDIESEISRLHIQILTNTLTNKTLQAISKRCTNCNFIFTCTN